LLKKKKKQKLSESPEADSQKPEAVTTTPPKAAIPESAVTPPIPTAQTVEAIGA
jgi:hypothetical protein